MKLFLEDKFNYLKDASQKLIRVLEEQPLVYEGKVELLTSHVLNAHHMWNSRIMERQDPCMPWHIQRLPTLSPMDETNYLDSLKILRNMKLENTINYVNSIGHHYNNSISDILFHVVNHTSYHRGQIILLLKNAGIEPIITDYIFYKR